MASLRAPILLALALTHLAMGGLAARSVLCIEPDGRISIKHAGALCCESRDGDDHEDSPDPSVTSAACCSCIDIALPDDRARSATRAAKPAKPELSSDLAPGHARALPAVIAAAFAMRSEPRRRAHGPPPPRTFAVLRC